MLVSKSFRHVFVVAALITCRAANAQLQPNFLISPASLDFGDVALHSSSASQTITVKNISNQSQVMSAAGGAGGVFGGGQNCQGVTLAPGGACQLTYQFTPTALGLATFTTGGNFNGQPFSISFTGRGIETFLISPTRLDFGNIALGTTAPSQTVTIKNVSNTTQVVSLAGGTANQFFSAQTCQNASLTAGAACLLSYQFSPTLPGLINTTASGTVNGQSFAIKLTGAAIPNLPGDYNGNGKVDAGDYVAWRGTLGQSGTLINEVAGASPAQVTTADYTAWRTRFGNRIAGGARIGASAVPEPNGAILIAICGFAAVVHSHRRKCGRC